MPSSITSLNDSAFEDTRITSITIPNSVKMLHGYAFYNVLTLTSLTIPASVINIYMPYELMRQNKECSLFVDEYNLVYSSYVSGCDIVETATKTLLVATNDYSNNTGDIEHIGEYAFSGCEMSDLFILSKVKTIGEYAFAYCPGDAYITLPDSLQTIETGLFMGSSCLEFITIPASVTSIGASAFANCKNLATVTFETTSGWTANGTSLTLTNTSTNAKYLTNTYYA